MTYDPHQQQPEPHDPGRTYPPQPPTQPYQQEQGSRAYPTAYLGSLAPQKRIYGQPASPPSAWNRGLDAPATPLPPVRPSRRRWWWVAGIATVLAVGGITAGVALASSGNDQEPYTPIFDQDVLAEQTAETDIENAADMCFSTAAGVDVGDSGHTLTVDGAGLFTGPDIAEVECVLDRLSAPGSLVSRIYATRALDGMLDGEWDGYRATWTYHPDNGLWIVIEQQ